MAGPNAAGDGDQGSVEQRASKTMDPGSDPPTAEDVAATPGMRSRRPPRAKQSRIPTSTPRTPRMMWNRSKCSRTTTATSTTPWGPSVRPRNHRRCEGWLPEVLTTAESPPRSRVRGRSPRCPKRAGRYAAPSAPAAGRRRAIRPGHGPRIRPTCQARTGSAHCTSPHPWRVRFVPGTSPGVPDGRPSW